MTPLPTLGTVPTCFWVCYYSFGAHSALLVQFFYATRRSMPKNARLAPLGVAVVLLASGMLLSLAEWTTPANAPLTVRLLQGNVKQEMKFEQEGVDQSLALYRKLITEKPADLIVTPETALPVLAVQIPQDLGIALRKFAKRNAHQRDKPVKALGYEFAERHKVMLVVSVHVTHIGRDSEQAVRVVGGAAFGRDRHADSAEQDR